MKNIFPVIKNNPEMTFLDSAATMQKPQCVVDSQKHFLENAYSVI
jgi:cysteine desulfurase/selenocysteine lyase